jgi:hypothetical protein
MTRVWGRLALSWLSLALGLPAAAAEPLSGDRLRAEVTGNTLTGFNSSGVVFSEFHAPEGRILGHNNSEVVVDGCWQVRNDAVCYYYARGTRPGTFCWRFERAGPTGYSIASVESAVTGVARLEAGNPRGHSDGGASWTCEGLTSGLGRARRPFG